MKRLLLVAVVAALAASGQASASTFKGVVVARAHGHALVAASNGAVHSFRTGARVGARVAVTGGHVDVVGSAHHAAIRGVVVRHRRGLTVLTAARSLLAVRDTTPTPATQPQPQPGDVVKTDVTIGAQGQLEEDDTEDLGQTGQTQVQAVVTAVGPGTVTVTVNGQPLTLPLPAGLTLPDSVVGTQVTFTLDFAGGTVTASDDDQGDDGQGDGNGGSSSTTTSTDTTTTTTVFSGGHDGHGHDGGGGDGGNGD